MLVLTFKKTLLSNFLLILIFLFITHTMAFAQKNEASTTLPIASAEFPPFKFTQRSSGKIIGFDTEIITEVFKSMGITPQIHMLPFKRADLATRLGNYAAYYTFTKNAQREKDYYYSDPISAVQDFIFFKKSKNISWDKYEDLMNYRLGYSQKYNYDNKFMKTIIKKYPVLYEKNEKLLLKLLANDRVDIIICEISVCSYLIKENPVKFKNITYFKKPIGAPEPRAFYMGFSKKWPDAERLRDRFNMALKEFISKPSNPRKKIFDKYGAPCPKLLFKECK